MIVADTSPLNYLLLIEQIDLLPRLYQSVIIPPAVRAEMLHPAAPEVGQAWTANPPLWLEVQSPTSILSSLSQQLGDGERQAISLALQTHPSFIVLDETLGRNEAKRLGLAIIGILGVLKEASDRGLLDLKTALDRLSTQAFIRPRLCCAASSRDLFAEKMSATFRPKTHVNPPYDLSHSFHER